MTALIPRLPPIDETGSQVLSANVLTRVRKLLAVAEHPNTPPEEADSAARVAERLIAKYAIDEALLEAASDSKTRPETTTMVVDPPYASAKTRLAGAVASAHGVRAITVQGGGEAARVILVGFAADLRVVDLLYTSLLLQATTSVRRQPESGRAFRRAFLIGFAAEVGERLRATRVEAVAEAEQAAGAASSALVLRDREHDVDEAVRAQFPHLRTMRTTVSNRSGLMAGRRSGADASLATGGNQVGGGRRSIG
ncbi:MAG TPA: DUF2786 domain-containing protein [Mycobacteriales bacterium]|jgi:hypothetical protein|nr:DUF2786 domain-containing protein [Mycobacteriales bacterium]